MPSVDDIVPADRRHLLGLPVYAHLGTIRPDDTVQVNPMWFEFDGEHLVWGFTAMVLDGLFDRLGWTEPWDDTRELPLVLPD